jgi:hypothetical protein
VAEASGRACAQHMGITYDGATMLSSISVLFSQHWGHERSHFKVRTARQISAVWWAWAAQPPSQPPALMFAVAAGSLRGEKKLAAFNITYSCPAGVMSPHLPLTWRGFPGAGVGKFYRLVRLSRQQLQ